MTLLEKLKELYPDRVGETWYVGGASGCPGHYEELNDEAEQARNGCYLSDEVCAKCWNREYHEPGKEQSTANQPVQHDEEGKQMNNLDKAILGVAYILDCLTAYRSITEKGCCNDCKFKRGCKCCPKPGEVVRYNCPLYEREPEKDGGKKEAQE